MTTLRLTLILCAAVLTTGCASVRTADTHAASFPRGAVAADHHLASEAGAQMLAKGGNAVDAAVAASFTLAAVRPYSCGLGGGGFMVIHLPDDPTHGPVTTAINYRETSPVGPDFFATTDASSTVGGPAVAVPGTIAGLLHALDTYGTLDRATVLAPAVRAAERGFIADAHYAAAAEGLIARFEANPAWKNRFPLVWETYLRRGAVREGDRITNPALARTLEACATWGDGATETRIRAAISDAVTADGGVMPMAALTAYQPAEVEPIVAEFDGLRLLCMPPPSSGGTTIAQTMLILAARGMDPADPIDTDPERHTLVEALKHAFADRARYLADPAFAPVPMDAMLDAANIARMAGAIGDRTLETTSYGTFDALTDDAGTSHLSAADRWGGAVACTETINLEFGSLLGVDELGVVLNNEMDDFTTRPGRPNAFGLTQSNRNLPQIGKRPLSSMSPAIVLDEQGVLLIVGASGGPRIITGTLQVMLNALSGMDAGDAVAAPRLHHQWLPDEVGLEPGASDWGDGLIERGHRVGRLPAVGNVQLIRRSPDAPGWQAASDPRKGGRPAGH